MTTSNRIASGRSDPPALRSTLEAIAKLLLIAGIRLNMRTTVRKLRCDLAGEGVFFECRGGNIDATMPLRIRISDSARADDLFAFLRGLGADAKREGEFITVTRRHPVVQGEPLSQDRMELEFILRAWSSQSPGTVFEVEEAA
jgi:hypothetical protein